MVKNQYCLKIVFNPHDNILRTGNDPYRIIRELSELGDIEVQCDADRFQIWTITRLRFLPFLGDKTYNPVEQSARNDVLAG